MKTIFLFCLAAFFEIGGCFAFWLWLRQGRSLVYVAIGLTCLFLFAFLLTRVDVVFAGRAFAAYGGIYIIAALIWLRFIESADLDRWDILGAVICLAGASVILFGPRGPK